MAKELKKLNANIEETEDGLIIKESILKHNEVYSYNDHRIAMALTIASLGIDGEATVNSVKCISKTYPYFLKDFIKIKANIKEVV